MLCHAMPCHKSVINCILVTHAQFRVQPKRGHIYVWPNIGVKIPSSSSRRDF